MSRNETIAIASLVPLAVTAAAVVGIRLPPRRATVDPPLPRVGSGCCDPVPTRWYSGEIHSEILLVEGDASVTFWWKRGVPGDAFGEDTISHVETLSCRYWPSYVEWVSDTVLVVAGIERADGEVVIEKWTFSAIPPSVETLLDVGTGRPSQVWTTPERLAVDLLYRGTGAGMSEVIGIVDNRGAPHRIFVRFGNSGDVHELDLETGHMNLVAGAAPTAPLSVPQLTENIDTGHLTGLDHLLDGYVYSNRSYPDVPGVEVYLIDSDRDGTLDRSEWTGSLADRNYYHAPGNYVDVW